jgi:dTDP-4-dehydrorhamnose reductase
MPSMPPLEVWAGIECTVNRVGERYFDQLTRNGHAERCDDLDRIAALGVRAMRYPVLWERVAPHGVEHADWRWTDERLCRLRELGIRPIVGLVHHGSGPRGTSLLDPQWPERLAEFAGAVARRYPWVTDYTPVNEPLTTARFSALYGHWYPHATDDVSFARAFLTQCEGVRAAMRAIRAVTPDARLVQTEDLGKTYSTPALAYQAEMENDRRWATFDLLAGRFSRESHMWWFLRRSGQLAEHELASFADDPCVPDVIGVNHYLTSERFLDTRRARYPRHTHGGNGRHRYADVEAVRVLAEGPAGPYALLRETWERYGMPIAVTEAHLGCTREQQLRWLAEVWSAAERLHGEGAEVRAVTAWSALGAFDWNSLLTRDDGHYEPGIFDVRGPTPRATALAGAVADIAAGRAPSHPAAAGPAWWRTPQRLIYPPVRARGRQAARDAHAVPEREARPVLVTGATGTLGRAFARLCAERGLAHRVTSRAELDVTDARQVREVLDRVRPWAVINTAGYVRVDDAEGDRDRCFRENVDGPAHLAAACAERGVRLLTFSSDLVFDGRQQVPYVESDDVSPLNVYGESKAEAERRVLALLPDALVVRTSAFFGPWDDHNFVTIALREVGAGRPFLALDDAHVTPTYVPELVHAALDLLIDGDSGIRHLANADPVSWYELACRAVQRAGLDATLVVPQPLSAAALPARRPRYAALGTTHGRLLGGVENAICQYLGARGLPIVERAPAVAETTESERPSALLESEVERAVARHADVGFERPRGPHGRHEHAPSEHPADRKLRLGRSA